MTLRRIGKIDVQAKVSGNDIVSTGFVFYSYAKNSNALEFHFKDQQGQPVDLMGTKVRLLLIVREDGEDKEFKTLDEEIVTESSLNGIVRYIIPDRLMGYQGIVDGWIYLDFPDGSKTDEVHFKFTIERSKIDDAFLDAGDFYIKDFEEIKNQVNQSATEAMALIDSTKAEFSALVAVLADANKFRTDIDTLETKKADKTAVNQLETNKADKTSLAQTTQRVDGLANGKVDKGGASQVTMGMLTQEVKTAMTGGSVAVVGKDAVSTTNIVDRSITDIKIKANLTGGLYFQVQTNAKINFNFDKNQVEIPDGYMYRLGYKYYQPTGAKVVPMTTNGAQSLVLNLTTLEYRCEAAWATTELSAEDIVVAVFNKTSKTVSINTPFKINGASIDDPAILAGSTFFWSNSNKKPINFDFANNKIKIPGDSAFLAKNQHYYYTDWNPEKTDVEIDLGSIGSGKLIFDINTKTFSVLAFSTAMTSSQLIVRMFNKTEKWVSQENLYVINGSNGTNMKTYVADEITRVTSNVISQKSPNDFVIGWITDTHNRDNLVDQYIEFNKQGLVDITVHSGDITYELETDKMFKRMDEIKRQYSQIPNLLLCRGNHDSDGSTTTDGVVTNNHFTERLIMNNFVRENCLFDEGHEGHYYYDDQKRKIRVIMLNLASENTGTAKRNGITDYGLEWLSTRALNFSDAGWEVIVFGHVPIWTGVYDGGLGRRVEDVAKILEAFNTGTTYVDSYGLQEAITYPTGNNVIGYFAGHIHMDALVKREELSFNMITEMAVEPSNGSGGVDGVNVFPREAGKITENCFDTIIINQASKTVYLKRFGAGVDREFYY